VFGLELRLGMGLANCFVSRLHNHSRGNIPEGNV